MNDFKNNKILIIVLLFFFFIPVLLNAISGEFLLIPPGARQNGLGTAFVGIADDSGTIFYNPAGLGILEKFQATMNEYSRGMGEHFNSASLFYPFYKGGVGGDFSLLHYSFSDEFKFYQEGIAMEDFSIYSLSAGAGYGMLLNEDLSVGGSFKFIKEKIHEYSAETFGVDVGVLYQMELPLLKFGKTSEEILWSKFNKNVRLGFSLQNIGGKIRFSDAGEGDSLPVKLNAGFYLCPVNFVGVTYQFSTLFDDSFENVEESSASSFGLELFKNYYVTPRLGYHYSAMGSDLFFGAGFNINYYGLFYQLDYVYKNNKISADLGDNHIFSVSIGSSLTALKFVNLSGIGFHEEWYSLQDRFIKQKEKELVEEKKELEIKKIKTYFSEVKSVDKVSKEKDFDNRLYKIITAGFPESSILELVENEKDAELTVECKINVEGELVTARLINSLAESIVTAENSFSADYIEAEEEGEVEAIVFMKKKGKTRIIKEYAELEHEGRQNQEFRKMAEKTIRWLEVSGKELISCKVEISTKISGVNIYVNNFFEGVTDRDGKLELEVLPGTHIIIVKKDDFMQEKMIEAKSSQEMNLKFVIEEDVFYSELTVNSYPSGAKVYLNGKSAGTTPLKKERIQNGTYKLKIERKGESYEDVINIERQGFDVIKNYVFEYKTDNTKKSKKFWIPINLDEGITTEFLKEGLLIKGNSKDTVLRGSGFISKEFMVKDMEIGFEFRDVAVKDGVLVAGLIDEMGNAAFINFDGKYFAIRRIVDKNEKRFVKALDKGKLDKFSIRLKYYKDSKEIEAMVGNKVIERVKIKFHKYVRVVILIDGESPDKKVKCFAKKIWIK